jgi:hypothetical protein
MSAAAVQCCATASSRAVNPDWLKGPFRRNRGVKIGSHFSARGDFWDRRGLLLDNNIWLESYWKLLWEHCHCPFIS